MLGFLFQISFLIFDISYLIYTLLEIGNIGYLYVTSMRIIWINDKNSNYNINIPYIQISPVQYENNPKLKDHIIISIFYFIQMLEKSKNNFVKILIIKWKLVWKI